LVVKTTENSICTHQNLLNGRSFLEKTWGKLENKWKKQVSPTWVSGKNMFQPRQLKRKAPQSNPGKVVFFWRLHLAFDCQIFNLSEAKKTSK